jgi:hypothetical protein
MLGNRCESCFGLFPGGELWSHHIRPIVPGERPRNGVYLCMNCHARFHTESVTSHQ